MSKNYGRKKSDSDAEQELYCQWRRKVFERDRFICQVCKDWKQPLTAHHLQNFSSSPRGRLEVDNGVTLCDNCHDNFHVRYGGSDNTTEQFEEFCDLAVPFYDR